MHDIYNEKRERTGMKFSEKTEHLREDYEFSLSVKIFVGFDDYIILKVNDNGIYEPICSLLVADETSIIATERIIYYYFNFDIDREKAKLLTSKRYENNFYDYWSYRQKFDVEKVLSEFDELKKVTHDEFLQLVNEGKFAEDLAQNVINDIFGIVIRPKVRPLIRKSNVL